MFIGDFWVYGVRGGDWSCVLVFGVFLVFCICLGFRFFLSRSMFFEILLIIFFYYFVNVEVVVMRINLRALCEWDLEWL